MDTKTFYTKLFHLVLPIAFQQFMLTLVSACDAVMLGKLTQDAMSAVSLAGQIAFVQGLFLAAVTIGFSMFGAQYWGNKDTVSLNYIFQFTMAVSVCISIIFTVAALLAPEILMQFFTNDAQLISNGAIYLRAVALSYFLNGISQMNLILLKNTERARISSFISCASVLMNILLNALLIFGLFFFPALGIAGAAIATVLARLMEVIWELIVLSDQKYLSLFSFYLSDKKLFTAIIPTFVKHTYPVLLNEIVWGGGFTMYSVILGHLGSDAVAAGSIASIAKNLVSCFTIGLGSGAGIMVGNELGKGELALAKQYGAKLCYIALLSDIATGLLLCLSAPLLPFVTDLTPAADRYLFAMMLICGINAVGGAINMTTISGIFCAGGDSRFGLICDFFTMWVYAVPAGIIAAFVLGLPVPIVFLLLNLDELIKLPAVYHHYKKYRWVKQLTV